MFYIAKVEINDAGYLVQYKKKLCGLQVLEEMIVVISNNFDAFSILSITELREQV